MTDFEDFNILIDIMINYFTGSYAILALIFSFLFMTTLIARGLDFRYATVFTLPFIGFWVVIGWFGQFADSQWIINVVLVVVALFYGFAVIKITT